MSTITSYEENLEFLRKWSEKRDAEHEDAFSLSALRKKGQEFCAKIASERLETHRLKETTIAAANKSKRYSESYIKDLCDKLDEEFRKKATEIQASFRESIDKVLSHKRESLVKMASTAPTQEQLNLLSALQIRKNSLTPAEIYRIATAFLGNYNALASLRSVAKEAKIDVQLPPGMDIEKTSQSLEWVEKYLNERCDDIIRDWRQMSPFGRLFFGTEWEDNLYEENGIDILDSVAQMKTITVVVAEEAQNETADKKDDTSEDSTDKPSEEQTNHDEKG